MQKHPVCYRAVHGISPLVGRKAPKSIFRDRLQCSALSPERIFFYQLCARSLVTKQRDRNCRSRLPGICKSVDLSTHTPQSQVCFRIRSLCVCLTCICTACVIAIWSCSTERDSQMRLQSLSPSLCSLSRLLLPVPMQVTRAELDPFSSKVSDKTMCPKAIIGLSLTYPERNEM